MIDFLVVEDNNNKYNIIKMTIHEISPDFDIHRETDVAAAIQRIKSRKFSFVIIDIQLPLDSSTTNPDDKGGVQLLHWIKHNQLSHKCNPPDNIIVISEYEDLVLRFNEEITKSRVFSYIYDESSTEWIDSLAEYIHEYIAKTKSNIIKKHNSDIVMTIHGIGTYGEWQNRFDDFLKSKYQNTLHIPYKYLHYPITSFLLPPLRHREVNNLVKELELVAKKYPNADVKIIAHSFGTYLTFKALKEIKYEISPRFSFIILSGSVLKSDTDWSDNVNKFGIKNIINDCAIGDKALILSQIFAIGLGMAGRTGFKGTLANTLINRYFEGGHSTVLNDINFADWLKLIQKDEIEHVDKRPNCSPYRSAKEHLLYFSRFFVPASTLAVLLVLL